MKRTLTILLFLVLTAAFIWAAGWFSYTEWAGRLSVGMEYVYESAVGLLAGAVAGLALRCQVGVSRSTKDGLRWIGAGFLVLGLLPFLPQIPFLPSMAVLLRYRILLFGFGGVSFALSR